MLRCLVALLSRLPLGMHYWFADWLLFPLMYHVVRYRRGLVMRNLAKAFPEQSDKERRLTAKAFYHHFCDTIVEIIYGYNCSDEEMRKRVVFENMEQVNSLIDKAKGGVLMTSHLCNWEWMASVQQWLSPGVKELNIYRRLKNKGMDRLMLAIRAKRGGECVEKTRVLREMIRYRAEQQPVTIGMLSDQKPRPEVTRTVTTFLNQPTGWLDGSEILARKFGYPVFYLYVTRTQRGFYRVQMKTLSAEPKSTAEGEITKAYAAVLEQNILEEPAMWLWTHNRWKHKLSY